MEKQAKIATRSRLSYTKLLFVLLSCGVFFICVHTYFVTPKALLESARDRKSSKTSPKLHRVSNFNEFGVDKIEQNDNWGVLLIAVGNEQRNEMYHREAEEVCRRLYPLKVAIFTNNDLLLRWKHCFQHVIDAKKALSGVESAPINDSGVKDKDFYSRIALLELSPFEYTVAVDTDLHFCNNDFKRALSPGGELRIGFENKGAHFAATVLHYDKHIPQGGLLIYRSLSPVTLAVFRRVRQLMTARNTMDDQRPMKDAIEELPPNQLAKVFVINSRWNFRGWIFGVPYQKAIGRVNVIHGRNNPKVHCCNLLAEDNDSYKQLVVRSVFAIENMCYVCYDSRDRRCVDLDDETEVEVVNPSFKVLYSWRKLWEEETDDSESCPWLQPNVNFVPWNTVLTC